MSDREYWRDTADRPSGFWAVYPVTKAVVIGIAGVYLLLALLRGVDRGAAYALEDFLALAPEGTLRGLRLWQLVTCALVHADVWHVLINAIGILVFGRLVEQRLGTARFLRFLLGTQLTASLGFLLLAAIEDTVVPMVGASGIDFGLLVLCAFWYPNLQILLFFVLATPLWIAAAIFVFIEAAMLFEQGGGVAHSAHLGGALYGLLYYRFIGEFDQVFHALDGWREKRRRKRAEAGLRAEARLREEVDRILDKVNREGMSALTESERRALKDASARLRR